MPRRRRSAPRSSATGLESLLDALAPEDVGSLGLGRIQRVWGRAVGADIAAAGQPVAFADGLLHVACEDATWAQELQMLERMLIERLHAAGVAEVTAIRARAGGVSGRGGRQFGRPNGGIV